MIDVKDLMCGNWIYLSDPEDRENTRDIHYIDEVCRDYIRVEDFGDFFDDIYLEPVPVTVDILKRIGFEKYEDLPLERNCYRYWDKDRRYKLEVCDDEDWCNSDRKFTLFVDNSRFMGIGSAEFTYVHELQNLVRVITGHSLPITKEVFDGLGNES